MTLALPAACVVLVAIAVQVSAHSFISGVVCVCV